MRASRTYSMKAGPLPLAGLREDDELVDVTSFGEPPIVRFVVEGPPPADEFVLARAAWVKLGEPERISVTVAAI